MLREYYEIDSNGKPINVHLFDDEKDEIPEGFKLGWFGREFNLPVWDFKTNDWIESTPLVQIETMKLKEVSKNEIHDLKKYLNDTDFYYVRQLETGKDVPVDVVSKRLDARTRLRELGL